MTDRISRALLFAIALGLWANVAASAFRPVAVSAGGQDVADLHSVMSTIQSSVSSMEFAVSSIESALGRIQRGTCTNDKIC